jgi:hypothetical protein
LAVLASAAAFGLAACGSQTVTVPQVSSVTLTPVATAPPDATDATSTGGDQTGASDATGGTASSVATGTVTVSGAVTSSGRISGKCTDGGTAARDFQADLPGGGSSTLRVTLGQAGGASVSVVAGPGTSYRGNASAAATTIDPGRMSIKAVRLPGTGGTTGEVVVTASVTC